MLIYTRPDGGVNIISFASKEDLEKVLGPLTDEEYISHIRSRSIPTYAINVRSIGESDIPSREFRNAWCDVINDSKINIDCDKAKYITLNAIRVKREQSFKELDREFMLALEKGQDVTDISNKKQLLRDITIPVKELVTSGEIDNEILLNQLRSFL